jgi:hypothetical protein
MEQPPLSPEHNDRDNSKKHKDADADRDEVPCMQHGKFNGMQLSVKPHTQYVLSTLCDTMCEVYAAGDEIERQQKEGEAPLPRSPPPSAPFGSTKYRLL